MTEFNFVSNLTEIKTKNGVVYVPAVAALVTGAVFAIAGLAFEVMTLTSFSPALLVISKLFGLLSFAASSAVLTFIVSHVGALVALIGVIVLVVKGIVGVPGDGATKPGPSA